MLRNSLREHAKRSARSSQQDSSATRRRPVALAFDSALADTCSFKSAVMAVSTNQPAQLRCHGKFFILAAALVGLMSFPGVGALSPCVFFNTSTLDAPTAARFDLAYRWLFVATSPAGGGSARSSIAAVSTFTGAVGGTFDLSPGYTDVRGLVTSFSGQYLYAWVRQTFQTPCNATAIPDTPAFIRVDTGALTPATPFAGGGPRQTLVFPDATHQLGDLTVFEREDKMDYGFVGFGGANPSMSIVLFDPLLTAAPYSVFLAVAMANSQKPVAGFNNVAYSALLRWCADELSCVVAQCDGRTASA